MSSGFLQQFEPAGQHNTLIITKLLVGFQVKGEKNKTRPSKKEWYAKHCPYLFKL